MSHVTSSVFLLSEWTKPGTKAHMKANDSVLCLNRILHIHSRRETHILSREHASARIQAQALTLSLSRDVDSLPGLWGPCLMESWVAQWCRATEWRSTYSIHHHLLLCKKQKDDKEDRSRQAPTLGLEAPGSGSRHFDSHPGFSVTGTFSFFLRGRQGPSQLTN